MRKSGEVLKVYCRECDRETKHTVLHTQSETSDNDDIWYHADYSIVRCNGCDTLAFHREADCSEWISEDGQNSEVDVYPPAGKGRLKAKDYWEAPENVRRIYGESIEAYNAGAFTLCAVGLRAVIEGICANKGVIKGKVACRTKTGASGWQTSKTLEGKINGLREAGFITTGHARTLHKLRFLGNDAVHDLARPSAKHLQIAIDVVEHTLKHVYEMEEDASVIHSKSCASVP